VRSPWPQRCAAPEDCGTASESRTSLNPVSLTRAALRVPASLVSAGTLRAVDAIVESRLAKQVVDRVVASTLAPYVAEHVVIAALESPATDDLADRVLDSERTEELVGRVIDSELIDKVVDRLLESDELWLIVEEVAQSPAVTAAISRQGVGLADQFAEVVRDRSGRADDRIARTVRGLLRRDDRAAPETVVEPAGPGAEAAP